MKQALRKNHDHVRPMRMGVAILTAIAAVIIAIVLYKKAKT